LVLNLSVGDARKNYRNRGERDDMRGALGSVDGPLVEVNRSRRQPKRAEANPANIARAFFVQMRAAGLSDYQIVDVIAELPKSRPAIHRVKNRPEWSLGLPTPEDDDE
jgi:hypothetical protein